MLLNAEESWLQRLTDPSAPLPRTDQRYDGGSHDLNTPVKNMWVNNFISIIVNLWLLHKIVNHVFPLILSSSILPKMCIFSKSWPIHLSLRSPLGLSISKRDSLLEKCAMFREAGGALSRQPSQDNGLDGPFSSGSSKLEQVTCFLTAPTLQKTQSDRENIDNPKGPGVFTQD